MPDSAVVARGRKKAAERGTTGRRRPVKQPLSGDTSRSKSKSTVKAVPAEKEKPRFATSDEVSAFAENLPEKFLQCRDLGHNWKAWQVRFEGGGYERVLRCNRCACRRFQTLSNHGAVLSNRYEHPEGYLHQGMGRIAGEGRETLRLTAMKRTMKDVRAA